MVGVECGVADEHIYMEMVFDGTRCPVALKTCIQQLSWIGLLFVPASGCTAVGVRARPCIWQQVW